MTPKLSNINLNSPKVQEFLDEIREESQEIENGFEDREAADRWSEEQAELQQLNETL